MHYRWYENEFPEVDETVMTEIIDVDPAVGATVRLLEYDNIEGMIMASEVSKKRRQIVSSLLKVGKIEELNIHKVDPKGRYIDLSRKSRTAEDSETCRKRYNRSRTVNTIMREAAVEIDCELGDLYEQVVFPLANEYEDALNALMISREHPEEVFGKIEIPKEWVAVLKDVI